LPDTAWAAPFDPSQRNEATVGAVETHHVEHVPSLPPCHLAMAVPSHIVVDDGPDARQSFLEYGARGVVEIASRGPTSPFAADPSAKSLPELAPPLPRGRTSLACSPSASAWTRDISCASLHSSG
jgi:hypothetical protein